MAGRINILTATVTGMMAISLLCFAEGATSAAIRLAHLLTAIDCYARVVVLRVFEIAYRIYTLPV